MGIFDKFKGQGRHRAGHVSETTVKDSEQRTGGLHGDREDWDRESRDRESRDRESQAEAPQQQLNERLTDREHESDRPQP
jgi:hypothetical protein